jgi:hypothetical protein
MLLRLVITLQPSKIVPSHLLPSDSIWGVSVGLGVRGDGTASEIHY